MKTALVTGANKGIGYEVVKQLLERNFKVILTSRNSDKGLLAIKNLKNYEEKLLFEGDLIQLNLDNGFKGGLEVDSFSNAGISHHVKQHYIRNI